MFVKITTAVALMSTGITGTAIVVAEPEDTLYPVKAEIQETIEASFNTNAQVEWRSTVNNDSYLRVISDINVDVK